jgi:hypothetical protein
MAKKPATDLTLTVAGKGEYVDARSFVETVADALAALEKIDKSFSSIDGGSIKWEIISASVNSPLVMQFHGTPQAIGNFTEPVVNVFIGGMREMDSHGRLPKNFPREAVNDIARLAHHYDNGVAEITFTTRTTEYTPSPKLAKNVDAYIQRTSPPPSELPPREYFESGTLDGLVDVLYGKELHFTLIENLTGCRVRCDFPPELSEDARGSWKKKAEIDGRIKYHPDGRPKNMNVTAIRPKPTRDTLPQFKGFYIDITGGIESSEYVRGLRDDD